MNRIFLFFVCGFFVLNSAFAAGFTPQGDDDIPPFPWGTECPFPWSDVDGFWLSEGNSIEDIWEFRQTTTLENGTHLFEIYRYNEAGDVLAFGRGVAASSERIIRAAMVKMNSKRTQRYYAIMRTYVEDMSKYSCVMENMVTVLTLRPFNAPSGKKDAHYIIRKAPRNRCERRS